MEQENRDFPMLIFMITYIGILGMYLVTYKQGSFLLWGFFIIERLLSFTYEKEVDDYLAAIELSKVPKTNRIVIITFIVLTVGIFLYTPFKYPRLFMILLIGESIDWASKQLKKRLKRK